MKKREFKDKAYGMLAALVKAMANPHRLEIIELLAQAERSVEEIATETSMSIANTSQHLQVLRQAELVSLRREGNFVLYSLAGEQVYRLWKDLRDMGTVHVAGIDRLVNSFRGTGKSTTALGLEELASKYKSDKVVLLDVRPEKEYQNGHIPGAINIPVEQLKSSLHRFKKNKEIITYCRGPFCVFADEAVDILTRNGFRARRLEEGFPDWKLNGYRVNKVA